MNKHHYDPVSKKIYVLSLNIYEIHGMVAIQKHSVSKARSLVKSGKV